MATRGYDVQGPWDEPYGSDFRERFAREESALKVLQDASDKATADDPKGFIMSFSVADGQALYLVEKLRPLTLCHIPFLDGYQIPDAHLRGLNLDDVKQQIAWRDKWAALAAKNQGGE